MKLFFFLPHSLLISLLLFLLSPPRPTLRFSICLCRFLSGSICFLALVIGCLCVRCLCAGMSGGSRCMCTLRSPPLPTTALHPLSLQGLLLCVQKLNFGACVFCSGRANWLVKRCNLFRQKRRWNEASLWSPSSCVRSAASTCCHLSSGHFNKRGITLLVEKVPWPSGSAGMRVIMVSIPVGDNGIPCPLICGFALKDHS